MKVQTTRVNSMKEEGKSETVERFLGIAVQRWSEEEVEAIRAAIEKTAEAVWEVQKFKIEPFEEPWRPPKEG